MPDSESQNALQCNCFGCQQFNEVDRQVKIWGEQNHPNGTGLQHFKEAAQSMKQVNKIDVQNGTVNWANILLEEVYEALAEDDPKKVKEELVQASAVALTWFECIERGKQPVKENNNGE